LCDYQEGIISRLLPRVVIHFVTLSELLLIQAPRFIW
jgi:hypothetical protein